MKRGIQTIDLTIDSESDTEPDVTPPRIINEQKKIKLQELPLNGDAISKDPINDVINEITSWNSKQIQSNPSPILEAQISYDTSDEYEEYS